LRVLSAVVFSEGGGKGEKGKRGSGTRMRKGGIPENVKYVHQLQATPHIQCLRLGARREGARQEKEEQCEDPLQLQHSSTWWILSTKFMFLLWRIVFTSTQAVDRFFD